MTSEIGRKCIAYWHLRFKKKSKELSKEEFDKSMFIIKAFIKYFNTIYQIEYFIGKDKFRVSEYNLNNFYYGNSMGTYKVFDNELRTIKQKLENFDILNFNFENELSDEDPHMYFTISTSWDKLSPIDTAGESNGKDGKLNCKVFRKVMKGFITEVKDRYQDISIRSESHYGNLAVDKFGFRCDCLNIKEKASLNQEKEERRHKDNLISPKIRGNILYKNIINRNNVNEEKIRENFVHSDKILHAIKFFVMVHKTGLHMHDNKLTKYLNIKEDDIMVTDYFIIYFKDIKRLSKSFSLHFFRELEHDEVKQCIELLKPIIKRINYCQITFFSTGNGKRHEYHLDLVTPNNKFDQPDSETFIYSTLSNADINPWMSEDLDGNRMIIFKIESDYRELIIPYYTAKGIFTHHALFAGEQRDIEFVLKSRANGQILNINLRSITYNERSSLILGNPNLLDYYPLMPRGLQFGIFRREPLKMVFEYLVKLLHDMGFDTENKKEIEAEFNEVSPNLISKKDSLKNQEYSILRDILKEFWLTNIQDSKGDFLFVKDYPFNGTCIKHTSTYLKKTNGRYICPVCGVSFDAEYYEHARKSYGFHQNFRSKKEEDASLAEIKELGSTLRLKYKNAITLENKPEILKKVNNKKIFSQEEINKRMLSGETYIKCPVCLNEEFTTNSEGQIHCRKCYAGLLHIFHEKMPANQGKLVCPKCSNPIFKWKKDNNYECVKCKVVFKQGNMKTKVKP